MRTNFIRIELVNSFSAAIAIEEKTITSTIINNVVTYLVPAPFLDSDVTSLYMIYSWWSIAKNISGCVIRFCGGQYAYRLPVLIFYLVEHLVSEAFRKTANIGSIYYSWASHRAEHRALPFQSNGKRSGSRYFRRSALQPPVSSCPLAYPFVIGFYDLLLPPVCQKRLLLREEELNALPDKQESNPRSTSGDRLRRSQESTARSHESEGHARGPPLDLALAAHERPSMLARVGGISRLKGHQWR